ncbi:hypothetical protein AALO_G00255120 [Alosa alosa]|uniref:Uncharacterized protein n=1 Tax=Alosa alosa TaxID=278164 RepID=A0AAV6FTR2_9TELE|nr:hypothetical protein AALO_G00255120 [Alosa alosa]
MARPRYGRDGAGARGLLLASLGCDWSTFCDIFIWVVPVCLIDIVCNAVEFGASLRDLCAEGSPGREKCITHAGIYRLGAWVNG